MPIYGSKGSGLEDVLRQQKMTVEEKRRLASLIAEAKSRGLPLPKEAQIRNPYGNWGVGPNGFFLKSNGIEYVPNEEQEKFIRSTAARVGIFGGRGSGKTAAGAQKALLRIKEGKTGIVMNPDFENLRTSTWPELRMWIPWDMVVPAHRYRRDESWEAVKPFALAFMNGAKMYVKGVKDPESARGPNVNWLWYDEGGRDKTGMGWNIATGGVRIGDDSQAFVTTTPKGTLHWVYKFFVKNEFSDEVKKLLEESAKDRPFIEYFHITIDQNKHNLTPDFYASMLATYPSGWLRKQELEGQFANEEGSLGHREWFDGHFLPRPPIDVKLRVRYWDLAGTAKKVIGKKSNDPDFSIGTLLALTTDDKFVIEDQVGGQWAWSDIKKNIVATALLDGPTVPIYIEQEPGAGGKNQIAEIQIMVELTGFTIRPHAPQGDKVQRANPWFSRAAAGMVWVVAGEWNSKFLEELDNFPTDGIHDDTIDSVSGAFNTLSPFKVWTRLRFLHLGMSQEEIEKLDVKEISPENQS